jgi:MFS family permease
MTGSIPAAHGRPEPSARYRWAVLVFMSLAMFGNYYVYDAVAPVADLLRSQLGFSDADIGWLNTVYSVPNFIMVLLGGVIVDRIGTRKAIMIFGVLCFIGAILTALTDRLDIMASGRLVFGIGAESLIVAITAALAKWFRGKELGLAFGVNLTIARAGSFAADNSPTWAGGLYTGWQEPLYLSAAIGTLCVLGAAVYWLLESRAERNYSLGTAVTEKFAWSDIFSFNRSYWLIVALCFVFYSAIFPFRTFAIKFFMDFHEMSRGAAGAFNSILIFFAMVATPLFGLLADRIGRRALLMMAGSVLLMPVYLALVYLPVPPYVPMALMGIAFSLIPAVMWPAVAYLVPDSKIGTAYGLMTLIQNIGLAGFNYLIGAANDGAGAGPGNPGGYATGMWIFSTLGVLGVIFAWLLRRAETGPEAHGLETIRAGQPAH